MDVREIFFTLDRPTILLNQLMRMHWAARGKHIRELAWLVREAVTPPRWPLQRCEVHIKRYSIGEPDLDGVFGGAKPLLDCLVVCTIRNPHGLGFIQDDGPGCLKKLDVVPVRVKKRYEQRTEVTITELGENR